MSAKKVNIKQERSTVSLDDSQSEVKNKTSESFNESLTKKRNSTPGKTTPSFSTIGTYDVARSLADVVYNNSIRLIDRIRDDYMHDLQSNDEKIRQRGIIIYLLDKSGYRIGTEKYEGVGITTMCKKHVILFDETCSMYVQFYGKHHVLYTNTHKLEPLVYKLMKKLLQEKNHQDQVFDSDMANKVRERMKLYGSQIVPTSIRTFAASRMFDSILNEYTSAWIEYHPGSEQFCKEEALKFIFKHACREVQLHLNEKNQYSELSYIDPRIILKWWINNFNSELKDSSLLEPARLKELLKFQETIENIENFDYMNPTPTPTPTFNRSNESMFDLCSEMANKLKLDITMEGPSSSSTPIKTEKTQASLKKE